MTGDIVRCGSARQIIGQWKYDDPQWETDLGRIHQSPYLAQRFDNGVFHLTVQSHTCRCMIAKASGDPDARTALALRAPEERKLHPVEPLQCKLADNTSPNEGQQCRPDNFQLFSLDPDGPAELPSAEEWLRMTYYNKADGAGGGVIDVYANNQFIVRAVGVIGYRGGSPDRTKFKFGIYRARVTCMTNMLVDHICFSKSSATCNADLELVPLPARRLMD